MDDSVKEVVVHLHNLIQPEVESSPMPKAKVGMTQIYETDGCNVLRGWDDSDALEAFNATVPMPDLEHIYPEQEKPFRVESGIKSIAQQELLLLSGVPVPGLSEEQLKNIRSEAPFAEPVGDCGLRNAYNYKMERKIAENEELLKADRLWRESKSRDMLVLAGISDKERRDKLSEIEQKGQKLSAQFRSMICDLVAMEGMVNSMLDQCRQYEKAVTYKP